MQTYKLKTLFLTLLLSVVILKADNGFLIPSDKLPSSLINCITQDAYGLIWVGTEYGLSRFDGYHFTNYLNDENDTTSITDNIITSFLIDHEKRFWIGTAKGVMQYDYSTNSFHRIPFEDHRKPRVYSLLETHGHDVLVGSAGYGLYKLAKDGSCLERYKDYMRRDSNEFFTHIYEDSRGNLWQSSHLPVFTCYIKRGVKVIPHDFHSQWGAPVNFLPIGSNRLMIVCMYGIAIYDYATGRLADAGFDFSDLKGGFTINTALIDYQGNLLLGTSEHGIIKIPNGSIKAEYYQSQPSPDFDIHSAYINFNSLYEDKDDNLWAGCYRKGLFLDNHEQHAFHSWTFAKQGFSTSGSVSSIASGNEGDAWCTVQNNGVYHFSSDGKIISHPSSPSGTNIIYRDTNGAYWIGTNNALYRYNPYSGSSEKVMTFESAGVFGIIDDGRGKLYVSVYSKGLYVYDTKSGQKKIYNMQERTGKGYLCNDWVRGLYFDHRGLLWIATSNGVACFNPTNEDFKPFGWLNILQGIQANALCEDGNGNIVIGTDNGLYRYNVKGDSTIAFPNGEELRNKQICAIVRDRDNDLWISTTMGIWQYDVKQQSFQGHIRGNGLVAHEYTLGSFMQASNGCIAFGNSEGITGFFPMEVNKLKKSIGKVYLTGLFAGNELKDCRQHDFVLSHKENNFTLEFSLLDFKRRDDIAFQYRINDGKWLSTDEGNNQIQFTQLEPGGYKIEVRAATNGVVSDIETFHISIRPPWYATTFAYIVYAILILCVILYLYHSREQKIKADADEQKMRFLIDATHDIRSPLTLIISPLKNLKKRITDTESQRDIATIDHNAKRLLLLVNQILDERKIDKGEMRLQCEPTDLVAFSHQVISSYLYNAEERHITISVTSNTNPQHPVTVWIDRVNFEKVISNLISNALKYTYDGGSINVVIDENDNNVTLSVIDSGIGFKGGSTTKVFDRFYQGKNSRDLHIQGTGIGLNLCRNIVLMHHGTITASNRTDGKQGACLTVTLLKGNTHLKPEEIMDVTDQAQNLKSQKSDLKDSRPTTNIHVLVVDDDPEIPAYISRELGRWYHFDSAANGKEALPMLAEGDYDLVISDVMMPEMDGITLLKSIKVNTRTSDIPVILLTSKSEVANRLEGLRRGADAFLAKPFSIDELHILIDNLIGNVRRLRGKFSGSQEQKGNIQDITVKGNDDALMARIMKSVNANMADPEFNVEMLAKDVGISRAQLHRKMKEITGISTGEFIRNIRLEQAAKLLTEGNINITQVAYAVGYNNQTHFSTVFKKHFGVSPTNYSKNRNK